jgi:hypothetical protein
MHFLIFIELNLFSRLLVVVTLALTACIAHAAEPLSNYDPLAIFGVSFFTACLLLIMASIGLQAPSKKELSFKVMQNMFTKFVYT